MVTATLPSMVAPSRDNQPKSPVPEAAPTDGHRVSPSISSELTITQLRHYQKMAQRSPGAPSSRASSQGPAPTRLAGFVGLFTGFGALVALVVFLPLPAAFRSRAVDAGSAITYSYYIVGVVALIVAIIVFFGLRNLNGEEEKKLSNLVRHSNTRSKDTPGTRERSYAHLIFSAIRLGWESPTLALGYLGGFVARASSVGISLFIPLFVNAWYINSGRCQKIADGSKFMDPSADDRCRHAYILSAELTGVSQVAALVFAPIFGFVADRFPRFNIPLLISALAGIAGYLAFADLRSPDPQAADGSLWVFPIVILLGVSQIGSIVCSLGLLSRGILEADPSISDAEAMTSSSYHANADMSDRSEPSVDRIYQDSSIPHDSTHQDETSGLLGKNPCEVHSRQHFKGSIAGVYSLAGGAGILLLTKLGGYLFDELSAGAPFYMLAIFNAVLLLSGLVCIVAELQAID